jgi:activating signal cointegrator 1
MSESLTIPVLGLWQPWACLVEIGAKPYETRHFPIPVRLIGKRVAIQATGHPCVVNFDEDTIEAITDAFGRCAWNHWLPRGCVTCTAILAESLPAEKVPHDLFGDYSAGRWAWRLEDVRPVSPHIPLKGRQMIGWSWRVPEEWLYAFADVRP